MKERLFSPAQVSVNGGNSQCGLGMIRTSELFCFICGHCPEMPQITLVSHQHNYNIRIGMISQLFQPSGDILVCLMLADIVNKEGTNCASVISRRDRPVTLLSSGVPYLRFDGLGVDLNGSCSELYTDRRLRIEVELVTSESTQQIGFSNSGVTDQDNCESKIVS